MPFAIFLLLALTKKFNKRYNTTKKFNEQKQIHNFNMIPQLRKQPEKKTCHHIPGLMNIHGYIKIIALKS